MSSLRFSLLVIFVMLTFHVDVLRWCLTSIFSCFVLCFLSCWSFTLIFHVDISCRFFLLGIYVDVLCRSCMLIFHVDLWCWCLMFDVEIFHVDVWCLMLNQVENVGFLKDKPKALHAFRVVTKGHIYLLSAKSLPLKKDWMRASSGLMVWIFRWMIDWLADWLVG